MGCPFYSDCKKCYAKTECDIFKDYERIRINMGDAVTRLQVKVDKYEKALKFYAKKENWYMTIYPNKRKIDIDGGEKAREALTKEEE